MLRHTLALLIVAGLTCQAMASESGDSYIPPTGKPAETVTEAGDPLHREALDWTPREWRTEVAAALRAQALAGEAEKRDATLQLVALYNAIRQVQLPARDERMLQRSLANRLVRAHGELRQAAEEEARDGALREPGGQDAQGGRGEGRLADRERAVLGQNFGVNAAPGFGAPQRQETDFGDDLVDLIERTVAPHSWEVNGGPGTIVYWPGLRALVISNTSEVHEQVRDLNQALRRAGN